MEKIQVNFRSLALNCRSYIRRFYVKTGMQKVLRKFRRKCRIAKYKATIGFIKLEKALHIYDWLHPIVLKVENKLGMPMRCENCDECIFCEKFFEQKNQYIIPRCYSVHSDK